MGKRIFEIESNVTFRIELDDQVIDTVDKEWRNTFYDLHDPKEIADMVGHCLLEGWSLSQMDGWGDQPDTNAKIIEFVDSDFDSVIEIK
jgi:hypothetical protein